MCGKYSVNGQSYRNGQWQRWPYVEGNFVARSGQESPLNRQQVGQVTKPSLVNGSAYLLSEVPESESSSVPISRQVWFAPGYEIYLQPFRSHSDNFRSMLSLAAD